MFDLTKIEVVVIFFAVIGFIFSLVSATVLAWGMYLVRLAKKEEAAERKRVLDSLDPEMREKRLNELLEDGEKYMAALKNLKQ